MPGAIDRSELDRRVAEHSWYHTIELAPGLTTPGWFDTRRALPELPFPDDFTGMRCLDIGTFDGFWAFEMERRGAAEVHAIDVLDPEKWDWPWGRDDAVVAEIGEMKAKGSGFELASAALASQVKRAELSVYDLDPEAMGTFDFVYVGSLLLHLRDPVRAVERVRAVTRGKALFVDAIDLELSLLLPRRPLAMFDGIGRPWWWKPNVAGLQRIVTSGGFDVVGDPKRFYMAPGAGQATASFDWRLLRSRAGREALVTARRGDPHAAVLARPR